MVCLLPRPRYGEAMRTFSVLALLAALSACGSGDGQSGPGGVTAGEAQALDDAAEMIEARRLPAEALRPPAQQETAPALPATGN